jgi:peptidoglycan-associated lipoprotein
MKTRTTLLISMATLLSGCAATPPIAKPAARELSTETSVQYSAQDGRVKSPDQANIAISDDILTACGIPQADAYFAFDSASVDRRARAILAKVSECFSSGPLAKRSMRLVGHADPRGDEEYNLLLGGRRAESVRAKCNSASHWLVVR